jgi:hypothetical protein
LPWTTADNFRISDLALRQVKGTIVAHHITFLYRHGYGDKNRHAHYHRHASSDSHAPTRTDTPTKIKYAKNDLILIAGDM